jgi:hypothetical protein
MKNLLPSLVVLLALIASLPASAANRYLYFMLNEDSTNKVLSIPMEDAYNRLAKSEQLNCTYTTPAGATAKFTIDGVYCPGESISLNMSLESPLSDGHRVHNYAEAAFVDHKSVYFNSRLNGVAGVYPSVGMLVVSASRLAKMNDGAPLSEVQVVQIGAAPISFDRPISGKFGCAFSQVQAQCR